MATDLKHDETKSTVCAERNTVGTEAVKLQKKGDDRIEAKEIQREADKEYFEEINKCVKSPPASGWREPFYVVVLVTKPGYLINVVRRRFLARQTMPTATPDQTVWRYYPKTGDLEFLWSLPDMETIQAVSHNRHRLSEDDRMLGEMVIDFLEKKLESRHTKTVR